MLKIFGNVVASLSISNWNILVPTNNPGNVQRISVIEYNLWNCQDNTTATNLNAAIAIPERLSLHGHQNDISSKLW